MDLRLKGNISKDGRLLLDLPPDVPPGEVEVIVRLKDSEDVAARNQALLDWLERLHADPTRPTRTREEVDAYLASERASWD